MCFVDLKESHESDPTAAWQAVPDKHVIGKASSICLGRDLLCLSLYSHVSVSLQTPETIERFLGLGF